MALVSLLSACADTSSGGSSGGAPGSGQGGASGGVDGSARGKTSPVSMPTVVGPISDAGTLRGGPWMAADAMFSPLEELGYVQEEFFFSGTAQGLDREGESLGTTAEYTTRILVARPENAEDFSGTVLVEWMNVTAEMELDVVWAQVYREILREGHAYVAMSVQEVGVSGSPLGLKYWDPIRYLPLSHPGDNYAFDIFAQGTKALFTQGEAKPMGNLEIQRIIATGESQSAALMIPYINHIDDDHRLFDGYLVHTFPGVIREDVPVPVLMVLSETEVEGVVSPVMFAAEYPAFFNNFNGLPHGSIINIPHPETPPADFDNFRVWELAGGSHFDRQAIVYAGAQISRDLAGFPNYGGLPTGCSELGLLYPSLIPPEYVDLGQINQLGMQRPVRAALHALNHWMVSGEAPAIQPRIYVNDDGTIIRDADGLATGGIRMPVMEAPLGVNEGASCLFFGRYAQFADVANRFVDQQDYLSQFSAAAQQAVERGVLMPEDAAEYIAEAAEFSQGIW